MKQLIAMMQVGAMLECERAKDQAAYGSAYEGFAHCKEKMDKVLHDIKQAEEDLAILWGVVTQGGKGVESAWRVHDTAVQIAAELVQLAGVCLKYESCADGWAEGQEEAEWTEAQKQRFQQMIGAVMT